MNIRMLLATQLNLPQDLTQSIQRWLWTVLTQPICISKVRILEERYVISALHPTDQQWNRRRKKTIGDHLLQRLDKQRVFGLTHFAQDYARTFFQQPILLSYWQRIRDQPGINGRNYLQRIASPHYYQVPVSRIWNWNSDAFLKITPYVLVLEPEINLATL